MPDGSSSFRYWRVNFLETFGGGDYKVHIAELGPAAWGVLRKLVAGWWLVVGGCVDASCSVGLISEVECDKKKETLFLVERWQCSIGLEKNLWQVDSHRWEGMAFKIRHDMPFVGSQVFSDRPRPSVCRWALGRRVSPWAELMHVVQGSVEELWIAMMMRTIHRLEHHHTLRSLLHLRLSVSLLYIIID